MNKIFERSYIFKGKEEQIVLFFDRYIIGEITEDTAAACIRNIDRNAFDPTLYNRIIDIQKVLQYEYNRRDEAIFFKMSGQKVSGSISFKDASEVDEAEKIMAVVFKALGLLRSEVLLTPVQAMVNPINMIGLTLFIGGLTTWIAYGLKAYQPSNIKAVKWYIYLFYQLVQFTGYKPFFVITILIAAGFFVWGEKRMNYPPYRIVAKRQ